MGDSELKLEEYSWVDKDGNVYATDEEYYEMKEDEE